MFKNFPGFSTLEKIQKAKQEKRKKQLPVKMIKIVAIAIIKISGVMWGFIRKKKLISLHTVMNKTTGVLLFLLPLTLHFVELKYSSAVVCSIATFSAIQEGYYIGTGREVI